MRSIRGRLIVWLLAGTGLLVAAAALALDWIIASRLRGDFDAGLIAEARAVMAVTERQGNAVAVELSPGLLPEFERAQQPDYFQIWLAGGVVLARSPSLGGRDLPRLPLPPSPQTTAAAGSFRIADLALPDGRHGRAAQVMYEPQLEPDDARAAALAGLPPAHPHVTLVVARRSAALDGFLASFRRALLFGSLALLAGCAVLVQVAARVALRPLDELARRLPAIDAGSLGEAVVIRGAPRELAPAIDKLNDLLERLAASFQRERTFSANLAHELRTPLAELRTVSEVALLSPSAPGVQDAPPPPTAATAALRDALAEAHAIGLQMESVVVNLLALARYDAAQHSVDRTSLRLREACLRAWREAVLEAAVSSRREAPGSAAPDQAVISVDGSVILTTDSEKLDLILVNLFANALAYGTPGSRVNISGGAGDDSAAGGRSDPATGRFYLRVENRTVELGAEDLLHVFDRFWRKDAARSSGAHAGLGLSLVRALCELLGFSIAVDLTGDRFSITLAGPLAAVD